MRICSMFAALLLVSGSAAQAGELTYQPTNPSFGGDPLNSSHLYQGAEIANTFKDSSLDSLFTQPSAADEFASALQSALIGGAASQITDAIFNNGAPSSGTFTLDGATVTYNTVGGNVIVNINDGVSTNTLTIPVP
ncbi:curli assembly protein CsgF [Oricola nitratireducens]|jgi:curli production assembly/transport component CsgF|uniref:curli assembly protein CsgF n=1 Tax=Oricola nitratireducens TaxID=2775868 RepID=UPI001868D782|nr:curli assembly protein CsgF [Oricola nitratireducens]